MQKLKYYFLGFIALTMFACAGDEELPFVEFDGLGYGAYPRLIDGINGDYGTAYNYFDVANSSIGFTVEFFDENSGQNVESYSWDVAYAGGTPTTIATVTSGSFSTSPAGLPSATLNFTFQEVLDALGLTIDDVDGGESFLFEGTLRKTDGSEFTSNNTSGNIQSTAGTLRGMFRIQVPIICPSSLEGPYNVVTTGWCGTTWEGDVEFVSTGAGVYNIQSTLDDVTDFDFSLGAYYACYGAGSTLPGGNLMLSDACNKLSYTGASRWGEVYTFNEITIAGPVMTWDWMNDYDPEAGVSVITRTDGTDWPPLFK